MSPGRGILEDKGEERKKRLAPLKDPVRELIKRPSCTRVSLNSTFLKDHPDIKKNPLLRLRLFSAVSPAPSSVSSVSMKSVKSMTPPLTFKHGHNSADERVRWESPVSPAPSSVSSESMKSDWSMEPPLTFRHGHSSADKRVRLVGAVSPSPSSVSSVSMKSDKSMEPPLTFRHGYSSADNRNQLMSPPCAQVSSNSRCSAWLKNHPEIPPLSHSLTNKRKTTERQKVTRAVNAAGAMVRTEMEILKKWADVKREAKKKLSESAKGVVPVKEEDLDMTVTEIQIKNEPDSEVDDTEEGDCTAPGPSAVPGPSAPGPSRASNPSRAGGNRLSVLTDAVLAGQRDTLHAQRDTTAAVGALAEQLNHQHTSIAAELQGIVAGQQRIADNIAALTAAVTSLTEAIKNK